jgi:hypothetical protein
MISKAQKIEPPAPHPSPRFLPVPLHRFRDSRISTRAGRDRDVLTPGGDSIAMAATDAPSPDTARLALGGTSPTLRPTTMTRVRMVRVWPSRCSRSLDTRRRRSIRGRSAPILRRALAVRRQSWSRHYGIGQTYGRATASHNHVHWQNWKPKPGHFRKTEPGPITSALWFQKLSRNYCNSS